MKKRYLLLLVTVCTLFACTNNEQTITKSDLETIISHKNYGKVKSYQRKLDRYEIKDSIAILNYQIYTVKDTFYNYYYELPIKGKKQHQYLKRERNTDVIIRLMDSVVVQLNKEQRTIYKFEYDEIQSVDEESLIYFTEDIGIIRQESYIWMNHSVLIEHPDFDKALLYGYQEMIRNRLKPFRSRKLPPPPRPK